MCVRLLWLSAIIVITQSCNSDPGIKKPNLILILADDQRAGTIHHLGNNEIVTPQLDRLAQEGTSFENTYIMGATHAAVCMPSRAMLLTGRNLSGLQENGRTIPLSHKILGETLQEVGYNCFGTGKWHNGRETFNRAFNQGDDVFFGGMNDHWNVPLFHYDSAGTYKDKRPVVEDPFRSKEVTWHKGDHMYSGVHSTDIFTRAAVDFIRDYQDEKPFFLYLSFMAPHDPRNAPGAFHEQYEDANIELPANFLPSHPFDNGELTIRDEKLAGHPRQAGEIEAHTRDYYAMISHVDQSVGKLLKALQEKGVYENSIIVFTGDNGLALGQHGLMGKQNLYEHSIKVPLIITGPGLPKDQRKHNMNYLFDLFPTLCDLLDIPTPKSVQGQSFSEAFLNDSFPGRDYMIYQYKDVQKAVREKDLKLIRYRVNGRDTLQLFNLAKDPFELDNMAYSQEFQSAVQALTARWEDK